MSNFQDLRDLERGESHMWEHIDCEELATDCSKSMSC